MKPRTVSKPYRQTLHWTAGGHKANSTDKKSYHFIYEASGNIVQGIHTPEDNNDCTDGDYAAHVARNNTGNIGHSLCGGPDGYVHGEVTKLSYERACENMARQCIKYSIPPESCMTHWEYKQGKVDLTNLPWAKQLTGAQIANDMRTKIRWYMQNILRLEALNKNKRIKSPVPDKKTECPHCGKELGK